MLIHNPIFTGSISLNGTDISKVSTVSTDSSSFALRITNNESTSSAYVVSSGSFSNRIANTESTASAFITASGSFSTRTTAVEATASQLVTASGSLAARLTSNEAKTGSFATTGSNFFIGNQVITGSVYIANDLIVQGSSSLQNITASAVSVGTNTIILNTATPILQFGGISVFDSGSTQGRSGSLLWNSINDHWINVNPSGSDEGYNSAMIINGPKNTGSLGNEAGLTTNYIPVSQGEDHITDSIIFQSGSTNIGINTATPANLLTVDGVASAGKISIERDTVSTNTVIGYLDFTNNNAGTTYGRVLGGRNAAGDGYVALGTGVSTNLYALESGYVGIGTTNPGATLHIEVSTENPATGKIALIAKTSNGINDIFRWYDGSTQLGVFKNSGLIGIGTTSPTYALDVRQYSGQYWNGSAFTGTPTAIAMSNTVPGGYDPVFLLQQTDSGGTVKNAGAIGMVGTNAWTAGNNSTQTSDMYFLVRNDSGGITERMRIKSSGYIGIGTTNPSYKLDVQNGSDFDIRLKDTSLGGTVGILFETANDFSGTSQAYIKGIGAGNSGVSQLIFGTAGSSGDTTATERMRITSTGNLELKNTNTNTQFVIINTSTASSTSKNTLIQFQGTDTTGTIKDSGAIQVTPGGVNYIDTSMLFYTRGGDAQNPRMTITGGGNVGIGTISPNARLDLGASYGASGEKFLIYNDDNTSALAGTKVGFYMDRFGLSNNSTYIFPTSAANPGSYIMASKDTSGTTLVARVTILGESGNVGIGITSPSTRLSVSGTGNVVSVTSSDNSLSLALGYQGTMHGYLGGFSSRLEAYSNNGGYVFLNSSSVWVAASDRNRKRNFEEYNLGLNEILGLKPSLYNMDFQKDGDEKQLGLIAQEVKDYIPLAYEQSDKFIGLNYNAIIVTMVNAIKELKAELDTLKNA